MDVLPLPPRPNLEQYKKRAKSLVAATRSRDANAVREWAAEWIHAIAESQKAEISAFVQNSIDRAVEGIEKRIATTREQHQDKTTQFALADAQFLIARAHGFENWALFTKHIGDVTSAGRAANEFELAADAVVTGDIDTIRRLMTNRPSLIHERSSRKHHATLLHYTAANGVEDFRQKTPANAVEVATLLLTSGAQVDAIADTYGGGPDQTTMNLLVSSVHPHIAGLQSALVELLLDFGANINGLEHNSSPLMTAIRFGYIDTSETLTRRGARIDNVVAAAAVGRLDLVDAFVIDANTLAPEPDVVAPKWVNIPRDAKGRIEFALAWACKCNRADVAEALLAKGVNSAAKDSDGMTAFALGMRNGMLATIDRLLQLGAPLEALNDWGGTVLSSTLYSAEQRHSSSANYPAVVLKLLTVGADIEHVGILALEKVFEGSRLLPMQIKHIRGMLAGYTFTKVERRKE